eukprot:CAMPEP_0171377004 /NCGR_PEP_ID=MMETSP0879-20121228/19941_1 /TAXON_ID=67004 /ORGANISM="Thalassiosira weissflogii, Strain CCMP1336" /LENGTH=338 /DNA_ID=CAMNT_0011887019 /DNA_START=232 /DNA_END=1248 /DNA_ORIENTATION=+
MALLSLYMAATTDPGAVPMGARPLPENIASESDATQIERDPTRGGMRRRRGVRRCRKCNDNYKPSRAHHDSVTGRCIVKMDHYCPWVCNAVGIYNHKFFILFVMYTFFTAIVSLALLLIRGIRCGFYIQPTLPNNNSTLDAFDYEISFSESKHYLYPGCDNFNSIYTAALGIVTVLFFFFTCCMLLEQGEAVDTNMSKIARMKTRAGMAAPGEYSPVATEFNEVFGGEHPTMSWHWFLPLPVRFPEWAKDNVLGYEWDLTFAQVPYQEPAETDADTVSSNVSGRNENLDTPLMGDAPDNIDLEVGSSLGQIMNHSDQEILPAKSDIPIKKRSPQGSFS